MPTNYMLCSFNGEHWKFPCGDKLTPRDIYNDLGCLVVIMDVIFNPDDYSSIHPETPEKDINILVELLKYKNLYDKFAPNPFGLSYETFLYCSFFSFHEEKCWAILMIDFQTMKKIDPSQCFTFLFEDHNLTKNLFLETKHYGNMELISTMIYDNDRKYIPGVKFFHRKHNDDIIISDIIREKIITSPDYFDVQFLSELALVYGGGYKLRKINRAKRIVRDIYLTNRLILLQRLVKQWLYSRISFVKSQRKSDVLLFQ